MDLLYPFKFKPIYMEKIWGGKKIHSVLNHKDAGHHQCGEAWVLSGVPGSQSVVTNGTLKGNTLNELVEVFMADLVGEKMFTEYGEIFPVLIKFIDANDWLSVQVHPDDELAGDRHNSFGKTEMWYILEAEKDARLICGFNEPLSKSDYQSAIEQGDIKQLLNYEPVNSGDAFYIPAGQVHALGPGILLAEIQQTSDITYRIYDWDRIDASGLPRELHTEQALAAIDFSTNHNSRLNWKPLKNNSAPVLRSPKFNVNHVWINQGMNKDYSQLDSFVAWVCLEGSMNVSTKDGPHQINVQKGETLLIPQALDQIRIYPQPEAKYLEVFVT